MRLSFYLHGKLKRTKKYILSTFRLFGYNIEKYDVRDSIQFMKNSNKKDLKVIEIGTFDGKNARTILEFLDIEKIYLIDPYYYEKSDNSTTQKEIETNGGDFYFEKARKILKKWENKITWINKNSDNAVSLFKDNYFDYIYIDGNHTYKQVLKDMENYYKKIKIGGVLAGHDICNGIHAQVDNWGVTEAFFKFVNKYNLKPRIHGQDWWIIKEK